MKHLKRFESFEVSTKEVPQDLKQKFDSMTDVEKKKVVSDLEKLAKKLGLTIDEMKDRDLVAMKLKEAGFTSSNENFLTRAWDYIKNNFRKFLLGLNIGVHLTSLLAISMNHEIYKEHRQKQGY